MTSHVPRIPHLTIVTLMALSLLVCSISIADAAKPDSAATAQAVDRLIEAGLKHAGVASAGRTGDEDFLRRVTFDLAGTSPSPAEVTLFGINPDPDKRRKKIEQLLASDDYAVNWSRYWRDVIFTRATNMRAGFARSSFTSWMEEQLKENKPWDETVTALLTASGDVREDGATALLFVQEGRPEEIAAEVSRIFLGVQLQCANCHDHPTDSWKREQFHQLAAFFPRVGVRPKREDGRLQTYEIVSVSGNPRRQGINFAEYPERFFNIVDRNRDGKIVKAEAARARQFGRFFDRILERGDANKDGGLSLKEIRAIPAPPQMPGRGSTEHYMTDLSNPASRGTKIDPVFFISENKQDAGLPDVRRREALAAEITSPENPWFARAFVNRIWTEMLGAGFYTPVDDMGPERSAVAPDVLDRLADDFTASGYDVKWLFRTIAATDAYQRKLGDVDATAPFAAASPTRLRSDQLYSSILQVLGGREDGPQRGGRMGGYRFARSPRDGFNAVFGFDPSTPQEDVAGEIPQALFMMNSPQINNLARGNGRTRLAQILDKYKDDKDAIAELYMAALARDPSERETRICLNYVKEVGNRTEAFEDLMWSLLNSSEFLTKR